MAGSEELIARTPGRAWKAGIDQIDKLFDACAIAKISAQTFWRVELHRLGLQLRHICENIR